MSLSRITERLQPLYGNSIDKPQITEVRGLLARELNNARISESPFVVTVINVLDANFLKFEQVFDAGYPVHVPEDMITTAKKIASIKPQSWILLGEGGGGIVYRATCEDKSSFVIKRPRHGEAAHAQREIEILASMPRSPWIVTFLGVNLRSYLILEDVERGDLQQYMESRYDERPPVGDFGRILSGVVRGLHWMHRHGFVHRDLKIENILLTGKDGSLCAKITDFGLSVPLSSPPTESLVGHQFSIPPECFRCGNSQGKHVMPPSTKVDIWALGLIIHCLMRKRYLVPELLGVPQPSVFEITMFFKENPEKIESSVRKCLEQTETKFRTEVVGCSEQEEQTIQELTQAMRRCLSFAPEERPEAIELVNTFASHEMPAFA